MSTCANGIWLRALAAHVFVAQALAAEVALGQAFQAVRLVRFEHVALQQRVVRDSRAPRCRGWRAHAASYLMFWPTLAAAASSSQGLQPRQHLVQRQLVGRAGVVVRQRHVGRLAGLAPRTRCRRCARASRRANRSRCRARPARRLRSCSIQCVEALVGRAIGLVVALRAPARGAAPVGAATRPPARGARRGHRAPSSLPAPCARS